MAQARVALLFAHAQAEDLDPCFAEARSPRCRRSVVAADDGGVRSMVHTRADQTPSPWYVERAYPGEDPWKGGALNGSAGDAAEPPRRGGDPGGRGRRRRAAAAATSRWRATSPTAGADPAAAPPRPRHRARSYYGLLTPGRPWRTYLADLNYHCYHVRLLAQSRCPLYLDLGFGETSDRWQGYVDQAGLTCPARFDAPPRREDR